MFKYKHGFCILGCQPFHIGHDRLIKKMMEECEYGTVVIGSAQESGTKNNPLPYFVRKKMIQNVWRKSDAYERLRIIGVKDVENIHFDTYVLNAIKTEEPDKPAPDIMYVGDDREYELFKNKVANVGICSRTTQDFPFLSGSMVRDMIMFRDERWKQFVHPENIDLIIKNFCDDNVF
ncbi:MAG: hypothetical protein IKO06_05975 [Alphaproteobacteria bacterium]|nr:hypothetical protein [Alphaproteobacteria bacterium]